MAFLVSEFGQTGVMVDADAHAAMKQAKAQEGDPGRNAQISVSALFESIVVDKVGPFPERPAGNRHLLVVIDFFRKWPEGYPILISVQRP